MASMVSRLAAALAIVAAAPLAAAGQERLTLDQAVAQAVGANPGLRAARAAEREGAARVDEARAGLLPRVDYVESWQRGDNPVFVFGSLLSQQRFTASNFAIDALNRPDAVANFHGGISVDQAIFDSSRLAGLRAARLGGRIASETAAEATADLVLAVTRAYGAVLQASAGRAAADGAVSAARDDLSRAEHRRDAGLVTEADVLSLAVHLAQMQERAIRAASAEAIARASLNAAMGAPLDRDVIVSEPAPPAPPQPASADAEAGALRDRPAARRADLQVAIAGIARSTARSAFLPQVAVQGLFEINGPTFASRASSWLVAGQLRWNLFAGLGDAARLRAATESERRAGAERENLQTSIRLEVRTARSELEAAVAREAVGRAVVRQALESQRIIRDRYESGLAGVADLLRSSTAVLDSESQRIASVVDVMVGQASLDRALGRVR